MTESFRLEKPLKVITNQPLMLKSQLQNTSVLNFESVCIFTVLTRWRYLIWPSSYVDVLQQKYLKFTALRHKARPVPEIAAIPCLFGL